MMAIGVMRVLREEWEIGYMGGSLDSPAEKEKKGGIKTDSSGEGGNIGGDEERENK